jgi:predicted PurR-regulated permease PerM
LHIEKKTLKNVFIGVALCIILYWILHETERVKAVFAVISDVSFPFVLGASLAFILNVPMRAIEGLLKGLKKPGIRRGLAVLLTFVAVILVLAVVFLLLIPQIGDTVDSLVPKLVEFFNNVQAFIIDSVNNNPDLVEIIGSELNKFDWATLVQEAIKMVSNSISTIITGAFVAISTASSVIMDVVIAIVFAVYCLFQKETLARQGRKLVYAFLPEKAADYIVRVLRLANATFSNFFSGQCIEVCILGAMFAISMVIFRMPYIPLVSVLVAVTAFIPVVGAWVGCVFGAFFILVANPLQAVWFVVMFVVLQQIENNLIYPRVVGTSIGLSGMWVLIAVGIGGSLMGVAGMFLMIPVTSVIYTLLTEYTNKHLRNKTIDEAKLEAPPPQIQRLRDRRKAQKAKKRQHASKEANTETKS